MRKKVAKNELNSSLNEPAEVYDAAEDSYLIEKYVRKFADSGMKVLDMGTGSGIQAFAALQAGADVNALDINPYAIQKCKSNPEFKSIKFIESDLFSALPSSSKFDMIIFNPPYLPAVKEPEKIKLYTTGGKHGYEIIDRFLAQANAFLKSDGYILLVFSSLTKKMKVDEAIKRYGFIYETLEEQGLFFERLYCYKVTRSKCLEKANELKITGLKQFSKGRRGIIFRGIYRGKDSVIKAINPEALHVVNTLENEAFWLKEMNKLSIGPKLYYADSDIVVMQFLDGKFIVNYLEANIGNNSKIAKVLLDVFDQMLILDKNRLEKLEMTRPTRHIIVCNDKPVLIDFERTRKTVRPGNVTQYLQFLSCNMVNGRFIKIDKNEIIHLSKDYAISHDPKPIKDYLKHTLL